jgi:hypothetical protein
VKYLARFQLIFLGMALAIPFLDTMFGFNKGQMIFLPLLASLSCGALYHMNKKKTQKAQNEEKEL